MRWLDEQRGPSDGYNQAALVEVPAELAADHLVAAIGALLDTHDVLRSRLVRAADGGMESLESVRWGLSTPGPAWSGSTSATRTPGGWSW